jgi:hypothetical protein
VGAHPWCVQGSLSRQRAIIPADGFRRVERAPWLEAQAALLPRAPRRRTLALPGQWEEWRGTDRQGEPLPTCTIDRTPIHDATLTLRARGRWCVRWRRDAMTPRSGQQAEHTNARGGLDDRRPGTPQTVTCCGWFAPVGKTADADLPRGEARPFESPSFRLSTSSGLEPWPAAAADAMAFSVTALT